MQLLIDTMPLDTEQKQAVEAPVDCHIRVLSTPGGGKTSVLVARVCHLIFTQHVDPSRIRIMSFSRQSAADVGARLPDGVLCSTIHSFCSELSNRMQPVHCMFDNTAPEDEASQELFSPDEFLYRLRDLLVSGEVSHGDAGSIEFLFVDEMQDLSPIQFELIRLLSDLFRVRVFGVGDRNQNIYGFRSSDARFLDEMDDLPHFPCTTFELTKNYRSLAPIIAFANGLVSDRKRMVAVRTQQVKRKPTLTCLVSQSRELSWLVDQIQGALQSRKPKDVAAIARTRKEVFLLAHKLVERGVPNRVIVTEGDAGKMTKDEKSVSLCTMHGSKGLEWSVVFLAGMNDTYNKSLLSAKEQQQEDNLIFVAATRARDELHVTSPGSTVSRVISRVPQDLVSIAPADPSAGVKAPFFSKGGQDPFIRTDRSVSNFVRNCSGELYQHMKQTGLLPRRFRGATIERLHAAHAFPETFEDGSRALYGSIVERVIFRQVDQQLRSAAVKAGGSPDLLHMRTPDSHANACFLFVRTDPISWDKSAATRHELALRKDFLAAEFDLAPEHVRECRYSGQPAYLQSKCILYDDRSSDAQKRAFDERIEEIKRSYKRYIQHDVDLGTEDGLNVMSDVATCAHICSNPAKTQLLFKRPGCGSLGTDSNLGLFSQTARVVARLLKPHFERYPPQQISSPPKIADAPYMLKTFGIATDLDLSIPSVTGICDLIIGRTIVEIKASLDQGGVQIAWALQTLIYAALARKRGLDIREIAIYNPLKGFLWRAPIGEWTKGPDILQLVADQSSSQVASVVSGP